MIKSLKDTLYVGIDTDNIIVLTIKRELAGWVARDRFSNIIDTPFKYRIDLFQKLERENSCEIYELRKA